MSRDGGGPTYDFSITNERGKAAIANGQRVSVTDNPAGAEFPHGWTTTVWHAPMPIASYLALAVVGDYASEVHPRSDPDQERRGDRDAARRHPV